MALFLLALSSGLLCPAAGTCRAAPRSGSPRAGAAVFQRGQEGHAGGQSPALPQSGYFEALAAHDCMKILALLK